MLSKYVISPARGLVIIILLLLPWPLLGQYLDITPFLDQEKACLEWNPVTETGQILKNGAVITFKVDSPLIILDYKDKIVRHTEKVSRSGGRILFHQDTLALIQDFFNDIRAASRGVAVILIDPGHGGKDPGAVGSHGGKGDFWTVYEKEVVLGVGKKLYALLQERYPDKKIVLTRKDDIFPELEERVEIANNIKLNEGEAILFISLHANSSFSAKARGFEVWHLPVNYRRTLLSPTGVPEENHEILPILNNMLEEEFSIESVELARSILDAMDKEVGHLSPNRGIKDETWFVVRKANMPAVLIELGFVSNPEEGMRLKEESYRDKLTKGIFNGINNFIEAFENSKGFTE